MSYRKSYIKNKIHKIKSRRPIFTRLWFWLLFLLIILFSFAIYLALFYSGLQVTNISVSGNNKVSSEDIYNIVSRDADINMLSVAGFNVSSKSILLVNLEKIKQDILKAFDVINQVSVYRHFPQGVEVNISERAPAGIFCRNGGQCFVIDATGFAFEQADEIQLAGDYFIVRQSYGDNSSALGQNAISKKIMDDILSLQSDLVGNFQLPIKEVAITSQSRMNITTQEGWQIYFDLSSSQDASSQIDKLNLLLKQGLSEDSRKNLRYVDLRPQDRAIVCDNKTCGG